MKKNFETASLEIPEGKSKIWVIFPDVMPDSNYWVSVQLVNTIDAYPQFFGAIMIHKKECTGFYIELREPVDSANYKLEYLACYPHILGNTEELKTIEKFFISNPKQGCVHKWKRYNGFMDSYDYCEHCDEKKK